MGGRINVEDHQTLLHIKSVSSGPHGFREEDFLGFLLILSLWELITPLGTANLDPRGMVGRIYVGETTKHRYILNQSALGLMVSEKKIFECSLAI